MNPLRRVFYCPEKSMSDLSVIYPAPVMTNVGGTPVAIRPVKLRHFEEFGEAAGGLIRVAASGDQAEL